MTVKTKYDFGEFVVLKHDTDKIRRMITGITVWFGGNVRYCLQAGGTEIWCFEFEINENGTKEKKVGFRR